MNEDENIEYPQFLKCISNCKDKFWENIFINLSYAKTPYGIFIKNDVIYYNHNNSFKYLINTDIDSNKLYSDIYNLFTYKANIMSPIDKLKKKNNLLEKYSDTIKKWSDIKKKNVKDMLVELFVINSMKKNNLNLKTTKYLLNLIKNSISFKIIQSVDIDLKDFRIKNINGITFSNKKIILDDNKFNNHNLINIYTSIPSSSSSHLNIINKPNKYMLDLWEKYINNLINE